MDFIYCKGHHGKYEPGIWCAELDVLRDSLDDMIDLLNPGGRLCIITFHSLEDRIVKSAFRKNENPCTREWLRMQRKKDSLS